MKLSQTDKILIYMLSEKEKKYSISKTQKDIEKRLNKMNRRKTR